MKLCFLLLILIPVSIYAGEEKEYITFSHQNRSKQIRFTLPLKCRLFYTDEEKQFGRIEAVYSTSVLFSFHNYDTAQVSAIYALDLKRKERDVLLDSLIKKSKESKKILFEDIHKVSVLSADANKGRQVLMLLTSLGFMGSGIGLMLSTSSNVIGPSGRCSGFGASGSKGWVSESGFTRSGGLAGSGD